MMSQVCQVYLAVVFWRVLDLSFSSFLYLAINLRYFSVTIPVQPWAFRATCLQFSGC